MLWNVRISLRQKLALAGIFSLVIITMTFTIVRVAVVSSTTKQNEVTWLYLWSSIEQTVGAYPMVAYPSPSLCRVSERSTAIVVWCLAPFRALFTRQDRPLRILENSDDSRKPVVPKTNTMAFEVWASSQLTYMQPRRDQETYVALFRLNSKRQ